jgi:hypothetical protein
MRDRIRHCLECPKCSTRYLVAFSPFGNGSYIAAAADGFAEGYTLFCSCRKPFAASRAKWRDVKAYAVTKAAQGRGYGTCDEIVPVNCVRRRKGPGRRRGRGA